MAVIINDQIIVPGIGIPFISQNRGEPARFIILCSLSLRKLPFFSEQLAAADTPMVMIGQRAKIQLFPVPDILIIGINVRGTV